MSHRSTARAIAILLAAIASVAFVAPALALSATPLHAPGTGAWQSRIAQQVSAARTRALEASAAHARIVRARRASQRAKARTRAASDAASAAPDCQ